MKLLKVVGVLIFLSIYSCATFKSVESTGKITQSLSSTTNVYSNRPCDIDFAFNDQAGNYCKNYELNDSIRVKTVNLLVTYGKALEEFIKKSEFSPEDQLGVLMGSYNSVNWTNFSDSQIKGTQKILSSVFSIINNSVKRKTIRNEILNNNEAFQNIIESLKGDLQLRKEFYYNISEKIEEYMNRDSQFDADRREVMDNENTRIGYVLRNKLDDMNIRFVQNDINTEVSKIDNALKQFEAAGDSHNILKEHYRDIGTKDDIEVLKLIINDLKGVYDGFDGLKLKETTN